MNEEERVRTLKERRYLSEGDGNFPEPETPRDILGETARDHEPEDLPKEHDPRSAPKGNTTTGQRERNPNEEMR
jgi:hypothetical protein